MILWTIFCISRFNVLFTFWLNVFTCMSHTAPITVLYTGWIYLSGVSKPYRLDPDSSTEAHCSWWLAAGKRLTRTRLAIVKSSDHVMVIYLPRVLTVPSTTMTLHPSDVWSRGVKSGVTSSVAASACSSSPETPKTRAIGYPTLGAKSD